MKFLLNNEQVTFNICRSISAISYRVEESSEVQIEELLIVEALVEVNFYSDDIEEYGQLVAALC